jgi:hypothetical protein
MNHSWSCSNHDVYGYLEILALEWVLKKPCFAYYLYLRVYGSPSEAREIIFYLAGVIFWLNPPLLINSSRIGE